MRITTVVILFILTVGLSAGDNGWTNDQEVNYPNVTCSNVGGDPLQIIPNYQTDNNHPITLGDMETNTSPFHYAPLWSGDRLVSNSWNLAARSKIAFDCDVDGYLYAAAITATNNQQDSIIFMKSTDNGYTWVQFYALHNLNDDLEMYDFDMRVDRVNSNPYIYFVLTDSNYTQNQREMWFFIYDQVGMNLNPYLFDPDTSADFVSPLNVAMDITGDATPKIWITYNRITSTIGWSSLYSIDAGMTWSYVNHAAAFGGAGCDVCVGPGDYVYITNIYTENNNRIRMNIRQFSAVGTYLWVSALPLEDRLYPSVASEINAAYGTNVVHLLYQTGTGSTSRIKNSYSTDGGTTWTIDEFWSPIGDVQATRPYVRCGWEVDQFVSIATLTGIDSLATAFASDENWGTVSYVNDYQPTGEITPQGLVRASTGRQIVYREFGSDNLWYDRYDMANSVEEITSGSGRIMNIINNGSQIDIRFTLNQTQPVNISLFDVSGRTVRHLLNQNLSAGDHNLSYDLSGLNGSYIVNFRAGNQTSSEKIFLF